jgi:hypothetical protein
MLSMLQAHGLDAGPTQRPLLAGVVAGLIAAIPAAAVFAEFGSFQALGRAVGVSGIAAGSAYGGMLLLGGLLYGWLFQRAANDPRGGWLFGLAFGFVLWMLGPIPLLQWFPDQPILWGNPAIGVLLGHLLWGLALGVVFPFVHRTLRAGLDPRPSRNNGGTGPEAVTRQLLRTNERAGRSEVMRLRPEVPGEHPSARQHRCEPRRELNTRA